MNELPLTWSTAKPNLDTLWLHICSKLGESDFEIVAFSKAVSLFSFPSPIDKEVKKKSICPTARSTRGAQERRLCRRREEEEAFSASTLMAPTAKEEAFSSGRGINLDRVLET